MGRISSVSVDVSVAETFLFNYSYPNYNMVYVPEFKQLLLCVEIWIFLIDLLRKTLFSSEKVFHDKSSIISKTAAAQSLIIEHLNSEEKLKWLHLV